MPSPAPEMGPFLVGIGMVFFKSFGKHMPEFGAGQEVVLWWIWNENFAGVA